MISYGLFHAHDRQADYRQRD